MAKLITRCSVCNKFVTIMDQADDDMCVSCALTLEALVDRRTREYRTIIWILSGLLFIVTVLSILVFTPVAFAGDSKFIEEYYVTGVNLDSGERIVGWLDGKLGESEVSGYVLDRGDHYAVIGTANGKGSFMLKSLCCNYEVQSVTEITNNKVENRKVW